jgi:hypothetical protein
MIMTYPTGFFVSSQLTIAFVPGVGLTVCANRAILPEQVVEIAPLIKIQTVLKLKPYFCFDHVNYLAMGWVAYYGTALNPNCRYEFDVRDQSLCIQTCRTVVANEPLTLFQA